MSNLREPAARADRREGGGRHGRQPSRAAQPPLPETHIRRQLLRIAVLPAVAVSLCGAAAVLFTLRSTEASPDTELWVVLGGAGLVALAGIASAAIAAERSARTARDRLISLRKTSARSQADLRQLVERLRRGEGPPPRKAPPRPSQDPDEFEQLAEELTRAHEMAVASVVQASQLSSHAGSEQKVEVFVNLARRLQSLVHREIQLLDELENEVEDPELLKGLFHVDHLATRIRRHAENLAVLGGAISRRQWSNPVTMTEVLRSAIAEVEQYSRVKLVPPIDGTLRGHAVADVIHLVAELVENATVFSAPHTQVLLRASHVTAGLAVEVEDRGLGMPVTEQNKMNTLLSDPDQVNVASLLSDGRIGLFVVSALARRHGVAVRLQSNIYGGIQAVIVLPQGLLGAEQTPQPSAQSADAPRVPNPGAGEPAQLTSSEQTGATPRPVPQPVPQPVTRGAAAPALASRTAGSSSLSHVPEQPQREDAGYEDGVYEPTSAGLPVTGNGTRLNGGAPLPVRATHEERPTPSDAVPGIRPEDRAAVTEHHSSPAPGHSAVRGTMGRPQLPKRRAQEHIVPQLREEPPTRTDNGHLVGHDPGLMAAFQRGIGLAEAADMAQDPAQDREQTLRSRGSDPTG
ncbi:ATP-binding protein [Streptomyces sp. TRM66268-LWL]|uniref:histidine kinase n=1 Tax=Streptomyces polyasparticus TaxID=2767826 RepID=A0ABR7SH58_9ACTN|nr:ATP-binding protein [Streptomyces polyasparticus]MBC9713693.1 ATP-binding protein [Streptomyces polyasparticus]